MLPRTMDSFVWTIVLVSVLPTVRGTNNVTSSTGNTAAVGINWLGTPPAAATQPVLESLSKKNARTTTADASEEGIRGGSSLPSATVRRSVEDEELPSVEDEVGQTGEEASLKQMALDKALTIQGRSTARTGPLYCDEFIASQDFYIHSPGYPENYPNKYQIYRRHPEYCGVVFTVLRLDLATRPDPAQDTREVLQDVGGAVGVAGRRECPGDTLLINGVTHCGRYRRGRTATFLFPSSLLTVEFRSREGHGASGFLLQGRQVRTCRQPRTLGPPLVSSVPCNKRVEGERFVVQSPGYPAQYDHNLECRYTVVRRDASVCGVQLMVESFSVENGTCMFDYLEVQGQRLCGTLQPTFTRYHEFEGNELDIRFRSDESVRNVGFSLVGRQLPCDQPLPRQSPLSQLPPGRIDDNQSSSSTENTNQLPSTLVPTLTPSSSANQSDVDINYILSLIGRQPLTTEEEEEQTITTVSSASEEEQQITTGSIVSEEDFTEVDPGLVTEDGTNSDQNVPGDPDFNPFTGTGLPPTFPTTVNFPATGSFPTPDGAPTTTNFPAPDSCSEIFTASVFSITSPNYPLNYPNNEDCIYTVGRSSLDVCKLRVNFMDVDIISPDASTGGCTADYLSVDGTKYCGDFQSRTVDVNFPDQVLYLTFHSDDTVAGRGFQLQVMQLSTGCGGIGPILPPITPGACDSVRQEEAFLLQSPGYPVRYPPSTDCTTTVLRSSQDVVSLVLELVDFEMATTTGCSGDYLEVAGQRLCGLLSGSTRTFPFVGNSVTLKFHSDADVSQGRGYRVKVGQSTSSVVPGGCGGFLTTPTASLQSPGYPASYPPNTDCRYIVTKTSPDVCQLQLRVLDMDVQASPGCGRDYLQVGMQERLCGRRYPGEIRKYHFTDYQLDLFFHSDGFGSGRGFSVEVTQLTCGHFKPMYPSYRLHHHRPHHRPHHHRPHHHRPHHHPTRPVFVKPIKPFLKPNFNPWWKLKSFSRPWHRNHRYSSHYTSTQTSGPSYKSPDTSYGPPSTGYGSPSTGYGSPNTGYLPPSPDCTTSGPFLPPPITPYPTTTSRPTFPPTILPTTETPFPTLPSVTPVFSPEFFPTPIPELLFSPSSNATAPGDLNVTVIPDVVQVNSSDGQREPKVKEGSCQQVITGQRFTIQSPGYPGPYYTSMSCHYAIVRRGADVCGVELIMDQFDVEESPGCTEARLVLAQRSYCGSIASGAHSVLPFPPEGPIPMEFVAGRFRSGAGFSLRGRQLPCSEGTSVATAASSLRQEPARGSAEESSVKEASLHLSEEAEWLDRWTGRGDIILHWVGPGGRDHPPLDKRGWNPLLSGG